MVLTPEHRSSSSSSRRLDDRWLFRGLVALIFWAPLPLASNRTWAMALLVILSQCLLFGACFVWRHHLDQALLRLWQFRWPLGLLSGFVILPSVQMLPLPADLLAWLSPQAWLITHGVVEPLRLSLDPHQTYIYAVLSYAYWSVFVVLLLTVRDARRLEQLTLYIVLSGLLQAILGAILFSIGAKYLLFFSEVTHDRVKGSFVYHNHMAGYMELCLSMGIGLMLARLGAASGPPRRSWRSKLSGALEFMLSPKMRLRLMLIIMVIALVLTRSRMGNSGFFAAMLVVGVLTIVLSRKMAPATMVLIASLIIIDVVIVGTWVGLEKVVNRVQETTLTTEEGGREESVELRQDAAAHAIDLVRDFPLFGTGAGSFYVAYLPYRTPREGYFDHAHNDYVEMAADYGLIGFGILGAFVLSTLWCGVQVLRQRQSSLPRGVAFGCLMAVVALMIHSTVDFNLQLPANAMTLLLIMGMAWLARALPRGVTGSNGGKGA